MQEKLKNRVLFGAGVAALLVGMVAYRIFWLRAGNTWNQPSERQKDEDD